MGIQKVTYLVNACFFDLESLTGEGSKNYENSLMGPNSLNNKVSILIGMKNKQTSEKGVRIGGSTCLHAHASSPTRNEHRRSARASREQWRTSNPNDANLPFKFFGSHTWRTGSGEIVRLDCGSPDRSRVNLVVPDAVRFT